MHSRRYLALILAVALVWPASAGEMQVKDPLDASLIGSVAIAAGPLVLASAAGSVLASVTARMENNKRWEVTRLHPQGANTALELRSKNEDLKIDMAVATTTARAQKLQVRDELDIEAVGKSGYAVKKGATTIAVLTQPGSGMVHSHAR